MLVALRISPLLSWLWKAAVTDNTDEEQAHYWRWYLDYLHAIELGDDPFLESIDEWSARSPHDRLQFYRRQSRALVPPLQNECSLESQWLKHATVKGYLLPLFNKKIARATKKEGVDSLILKCETNVLLVKLLPTCIWKAVVTTLGSSISTTVEHWTNQACSCHRRGCQDHLRCCCVCAFGFWICR